MKAFLRKLKRSLSARLLALFIAVGALLIILLVVTFVHGFARQWQSNARPHLEQYLDFISEEIGNPPSAENAQALAQRLPVNIYISGPDTNYSTNGEELDLDGVYFGKGRKHRRFANDNEELRREIFFSGDENRTLLRSSVGDYLVYYELPHRHNEQERRRFIAPVLLCLLTIIGGCFLLLRRMLRPVGDIKAGVKLMGQGHLDHRVPVRADNDLGELASSINTMASDIEQMLDAKRQLLLGASHELRSPLTRAKVATQLIENPRQRELLEENLLEMEHLITDILESERMKSGHAVLELSNVDLIQLVESVVSEMQAEGVVVESPDTLPTLQLDETRITILLRNLISNALTHNGNTSPVKVALQQQGNAVLIAVCDSGPGIAPEHIEKLTEPFYRTDDSRTRSTGGFGLGLHLAKLIVEAHGGQLRIISSTTASGEFGGSTGTRVEVDLPVLGNR